RLRAAPCTKNGNTARARRGRGPFCASSSKAQRPRFRGAIQERNSLFGSAGRGPFCASSSKEKEDSRASTEYDLGDSRGHRHVHRNDSVLWRAKLAEHSLCPFGIGGEHHRPHLPSWLE